MATIKGTPRRAAIYTRVSSAKQGEEGTSLISQYEACVAMAKSIGAEVVARYEETQSGGLYLARGELQKALADIETGRADTLIIYKLDRGGRDTDALRDIKRRVETAGAALVFADGMKFESNATGNLLFNMVGAFAEHEREVIRERTVAGSVRRAQQGKMPTASKSPYGYYVIPKGDILRGIHAPGTEGTYIIVEEQARWVREIFKRMAGGDSLRSVATFLQKSGALTSTGLSLWRPGTLRLLIQNPVYKGEPAYRKTRRIVDEKRLAQGFASVAYSRARPDAERITMSAPAIVSAEEWQRANDRLGSNREEMSGRKDRRHMLTGILFCPLCGARMNSFAHQSPKVNLKTGGVKRIHLYRCARSVKVNASATPECSMNSCTASVLEKLVIEAVVEWLSNPALQERTQKAHQEMWREKKQARNNPQRIKELQTEVQRYQKKAVATASAMVDMRLEGKPYGPLETVWVDAETKRARCQAELEELLADAQTEQFLPVFPVLDFDAVEPVFKDEGIPAHEKNRLLTMLIERIEPLPYPARWKGSRAPGLRRCDAFSVGGVKITLVATGSSVPVLSKFISGFYRDNDTKHSRYLPVWETTLHYEV